jgi:hypothetical protein
MAFAFQKVDYSDLNARQKENYNFQKVSAILAEYGFVTIRLTDDWEGADFIAKHIGGDYLLVQLKGRIDFRKKYEGKDLYICCPRPDGGCYLYPHDELLKKVSDATDMKTTESWAKAGGYSFSWGWLPAAVKGLAEEYKLEPVMATPRSEESSDERDS